MTCPFTGCRKTHPAKKGLSSVERAFRSKNFGQTGYPGFLG